MHERLLGVFGSVQEDGFMAERRCRLSFRAIAINPL
jgi:hypothetical protein